MSDSKKSSNASKSEEKKIYLTEDMPTGIEEEEEKEEEKKSKE